MTLEILLVKFWGVLAAGVGLIIWLIRLEARTLQHDQEFARMEKAHTEEIGRLDRQRKEDLSVAKEARDDMKALVKEVRDDVKKLLGERT